MLSPTVIAKSSSAFWCASNIRAATPHSSPPPVPKSPITANLVLLVPALKIDVGLITAVAVSAASDARASRRVIRADVFPGILTLILISRGRYLSSDSTKRLSSQGLFDQEQIRVSVRRMKKQSKFRQCRAREHAEIRRANPIRIDVAARAIFGFLTRSFSLRYCLKFGCETDS